MYGRRGGKQHMLCWHLSLVLELWVMETSLTQPVIKHTQRPLWEGSSFWIFKETMGIKGRMKWTRTLVKMKRQYNHHIQPCFGDLFKMCLLLQQAKRICRKERGVHMTSHKQADSAGWVHVGAGVACRDSIYGRTGDILSLLITVWLLCILNNTITWYKPDKQVMWRRREGGLGKKESEQVWSLRNRWKTIEMVDNAQHKCRQSEVCKWVIPHFEARN